VPKKYLQHPQSGIAGGESPVVARALFIEAGPIRMPPSCLRISWPQQQRGACVAMLSSLGPDSTVKEHPHSSATNVSPGRITNRSFMAYPFLVSLAGRLSALYPPPPPRKPAAGQATSSTGCARFR
jgi:hypothetical protein